MKNRMCEIAFFRVFRLFISFMFFVFFSRFFRLYFSLFFVFIFVFFFSRFFLLWLYFGFSFLSFFVCFCFRVFFVFFIFSRFFSFFLSIFRLIYFQDISAILRCFQRYKEGDNPNVSKCLWKVAEAMDRRLRTEFRTARVRDFSKNIKTLSAKYIYHESLFTAFCRLVERDIFQKCYCKETLSKSTKKIRQKSLLSRQKSTTF